jgi:AraC-like DNA-binding protein
MSQTIRSAALVSYAVVAREVGINPLVMLRRHDIDPGALRDGEMRIPVSRVAALLEATADASGCCDFGLRMAEQRRVSDFGVLSLLMSYQPTLWHVLDVMVRYRNLLNATLALHVEEADDIAVVREDIVVNFDAPKIQAYQLAVGTLSNLFHSVLGPRWKPISAHFTYACPKDMGLHRKLFGERIEFESEFNGLTCLLADLHRPNALADPKLAQYAAEFVDSIHQVENSSIAHEVRRSLYRLLPLGHASIARVASSLGLHERTLQRKLAADGAEFSDLLNGVRRELAERYLPNRSYSLTRVAEMLGYAQLSSFTRWFAGEFGAPPGTWRERNPPRADSLPSSDDEKSRERQLPDAGGRPDAT